jgi:hypothetical protein
MATKLEVINNIMQRLRLPKATATETSPYSILIASFVVESYEEVLDE